MSHVTQKQKNENLRRKLAESLVKLARLTAEYEKNPEEPLYGSMLRARSNRQANLRGQIKNMRNAIDAINYKLLEGGAL